MHRTSIRQIMNSDVCTVACGIPLRSALLALTEHSSGFLVVLEEGKPVGVLSERDAVQLLACEASLDHLTIDEVMSMPVRCVSPEIDVFSAYEELAGNRIRHLVIVDEEGKALGLVSLGDFLANLGMEYFIELKEAVSIMQRLPVAPTPETSLREVLRLMSLHQLSALVIEELGVPVGIFTERDAALLVHEGQAQLQQPVAARMSSPVCTVAGETFISEVNALMKSEQIRHMVVVDGKGSTLGMIDQSDLLRGMESRYISFLKKVIVEQEADLSLSLKQFHTLFEYSHNAVLAFDVRGRMDKANRTACELTGYSQRQLRTLTFEALVFPEDQHAAMQGLHRAIQGHRNHRTFRIHRADGETVHLFVNFLPIIGNGQVHHVYAIAHDISEQKRDEEALNAAARMESTARLAAGVAHLINNQMASVIGLADLIRMQNPGTPGMHRQLQRIVHSGEEASRLACELLAFARGGSHAPQPATLAQVIEPLVHTWEQSMPVEGKLICRFAPDCQGVEVDLAQMRTALINLFDNALQAIGSHGTIELSACDIDIDAQAAAGKPGLRPGSYVQIEMCDNGKGIAPEHLGKLFDPFFTTHFHGRGLGLSACYGIVKRHGGYIEVESRPGAGTLVQLLLPASTRQPVAQLPYLPVDFVGVEQEGGATILLVDDDASLRMVLQEILDAWGYRVLTAENGAQAVELVRNHPGVIDLTLLDMLMPVLGGAATYPLLRAARPEMKIVLCTGYESDTQLAQLPEQPPLLKKPFAPGQLESVLREQLAEKG